MRFSRVYLGLFTLWPVLAILGGQGFSSFIVVTGILAIFWCRQFRFDFSRTGLCLAVFLGWALFSSLWSPYDPPLISGHLLEQNFAIKSGALRLSLLAILAGLLLLALRPMFEPSRSRRVRFITIIFYIHGLAGIIIGYVLWVQYSALVSPEAVQRASEMMQNLTRSQNSFALIIPILLARAKFHRRYELSLFQGALICGAAVISVIIGASAAVLAIMLGCVGCIVAQNFPRTMLKLSFATLAGLTLFMPAIIWLGTVSIDTLSLSLPDSVHSRIIGWEYTLDMIAQRPLTGHGLDATRTWTDTFSTRPELANAFPEYWASFQLVAGHPHNMPLHIWAETGLVGIVLFLVCIGAIYQQLRQIAADSFLSPAISGLVFAFIPIYCSAYGVWNDAFWAGVFLIIVSMFLIWGDLKNND